jgi:asparagine synthase (glutamine-hydrolysing)
VKTYSIGFEEEEYDELPFARMVSRQYGTDHHEFVVKPDAAAIIPTLVWHYDEPYADESAVPTYYLSKLTRQHVTVALNGDAGDENFSGYSRYVVDPKLARFDRLPAPLRQTLLAAINALPSGRRYRCRQGGRSSLSFQQGPARQRWPRPSRISRGARQQ